VLSLEEKYIPGTSWSFEVMEWEYAGTVKLIFGVFPFVGIA
jgi:hypothetical protein